MKPKRHVVTEWIIGVIISINPVVGLAIYAKYLERIAKEENDNGKNN